MKQFLIIVICSLIVFVAVHQSLRRQTLPDADLTYALGSSLTSLDPAQMQWNEEIRLAIALWEGLTTYHPETTAPIEGVAHLPPAVSDDGLVYTFTLRQDARWSNGDPVDPVDFIYGWRRSMEPGATGPYAFLILDNIAGAKVYFQWRSRASRALSIMQDIIVGDKEGLSEEDRAHLLSLGLPVTGDTDWQQTADDFRTQHISQIEERFRQVGLKRLDAQRLEVRLNRPISYFLDLTAFSTLLPIHRSSLEMLRETEKPTEKYMTSWKYDSQWVKPDYHKNGYPGLITNGPFYLDQWQFKRYLLLKKNPHYWDHAQVKSDSIMLKVYTDPSTGFLTYEKGDYDWFRNLTSLDFADALVAKLENGQRDDIHLSAAFGTYFYYFNCMDELKNGSVNPFADYRVRMAFNLATDKNAIVDKVRKTGNPVARNFIPPGTIPGYYCPPGPDFNPDRARQLLAVAGYPGGKDMPNVEILYNTGFNHESIAEAIAQMWADNLNVNVTLKGKETKTFDEDKSNQRFMVGRGGWFGDYGDPTTFLDMMHSENYQNDCKFSNPEYDRLMERASQSRDHEKRLEILAEAEQLLMEKHMPVLPINYYVNLNAYRPEVKGIYENGRDLHPFKYIYVEKSSRVDKP